MSALACLRIMIDPEPAAAGGETLAILANEVASAFFECRWLGSRRFGELAPYAFLLGDARGTRLDPQELVALAEALQHRLLGTEGRGNVRLALFEGAKDAASAFASLDSRVVWDLLADADSVDGVSGRVTEISREGVRVAAPAAEAGDLVPPMSRAAAVQDIQIGYRAIWDSFKHTMCGNSVVARRSGARLSFSIVDGPLAMPLGESVAFDTTSLWAARVAVRETAGLIYLPISFASMVQRQTREAYLAPLEQLPAASRERLVAAVYDVPRAPTFSALIKLKTLLDPHFGGIDLQTTDTAFRIEDIAGEIATSVTFSLPNADEASRLAAATQFMSKMHDFKRQRVRPAITNVRNARELEHCVRLRAPFLSGRAVSERLEGPSAPERCGADQLPYGSERRRQCANAGALALAG